MIPKRKSSVKNVIDEILIINEKYNSLEIVDDTFFADRNRAENIFNEIIDNGIEFEIYLLGVRIDDINRDICIKMKKAGVKYFEFGIESGNQDVLNFYDKRITLNQIEKNIQLAHDMGFITLGNFILGAPIETKKHIEKTIKFACSLPINYVQFHPLGYQKGSKLWEDLLRDNRINEDEYTVISSPKRGIGNFEHKQLIRYCKKAYRKFYLYKHIF